MAKNKKTTQTKQECKTKILINKKPRVEKSTFFLEFVMKWGNCSAYVVLIICSPVCVQHYFESILHVVVRC